MKSVAVEVAAASSRESLPPESGKAAVAAHETLKHAVDMKKDTEKPLGETTKPESRRYGNEAYKFLVHVPLRHPTSVFEYLGGQAGFRAKEGEKPLNASLIDSAHTATFEGRSGLIIKQPDSSEDVTGVWPNDAGADSETSGPRLSGDEALAGTKPGEYNQVHLRATGGIEGVFIRVAADSGEELGPAQTNQELRQLAIEQGIPVAEVEVQPREIKEGTPAVSETRTTGVGDLHQIILPHNGFEYRIDVLTGANVSYADAEGTATRVAKVDSYDVWDRELSPEDVASIAASLKSLASVDPTILAAVERQLASK